MSLKAANFGQPTNMLNRQLGGISQPYQIGGPRSAQFALTLQFLTVFFPPEARSFETVVSAHEGGN